MIVVDSNVIAYFYIQGEFTHKAIALYDANPAWAAPQLWRSEFRNILAGYMRRGTLTLAQAHARQSAAETLLANAELSVDSLSVLNLANESDCSAYDCEFVALAVKLETQLVTMDKKLLRAYPKYCAAL
jgi:predicted nucleic acid-binding protein